MGLVGRSPAASWTSKKQYSVASEQYNCDNEQKKSSNLSRSVLKLDKEDFFITGFFKIFLHKKEKFFWKEFSRKGRWPGLI